ncbi:MAG: hypothetical protein Q4D38_04865 [Planctomycetia bacterium]|nr:hypothetical protein [Planctomycetia bacterium]
MRISFTLGILCAALPLFTLASGCRSGDGGGRKTVQVESQVPLGTYDQGKLQQASGEYLKAVASYRQAIACSPDPLERDLAKIGAAECLLALKKYPAALAALEPLPLQVVLETDALKLALAGESLLHQNRYEEAEVYLEIALNSLDLESFAQTAQEGSLTSAPAWVAPAAANLGCACLKNDKPEEAMVMYQFSAMMYRANGNTIEANKSEGMYNDLASVIRQYAPHKPIPVVKGGHPGKF